MPETVAGRLVLIDPIIGDSRRTPMEPRAGYFIVREHGLTFLAYPATLFIAEGATHYEAEGGTLYRITRPKVTNDGEARHLFEDAYP